jgi:hypothetical protein
MKTEEPITQNIQNQGSPISYTLSKEAVEEMIEAANTEVLRKSTDEINKQNQANLTTFISIFGIFASIITFLGIEIQFLGKMNNTKEVLGFSLVLFAMLISFSVALDHLIRNRLDKETSKPILYFYILVAVMLVFGIILVVWK